MTFLAIVIAFLSGAFQAQSPAQVMHGMIVDVYDRPIVGATVSLSRLPEYTLVGAASTGNDGGFDLERIPAGIYTLTAESVDSQLSGSKPVAVTGARDAPGIKLVMREAGIVSGRVLDEKGEVIAGARVEILRIPSDPLPVAGPKSAASQTDANGKYRLLGMPPGQYIVRAFAQFQPGRAQYPVTYYPGVTGTGAAAVLTVAAANEVSNIDIHLAPVGVSVRGRIIGPVVKPPQFALIPRSQSDINNPLPTIATEKGENAFEILGVAPGSYYLYYLANLNPLTMTGPLETNPLVPDSKVRWARTAIEVDSGGLDGVSILVAPPGRIKGRIAIAPDSNNADKFDFSTIKLGIEYAESVPPIGNPSSPVFPELNNLGQFELGHVAEGLLKIEELDLPDGWFLSQVRQDDQDMASSGLSVGPGQTCNVELVISNSGGILIGTTLDPDRNPIPSSRYVLLPDDPGRQSNPLFVKSGSSYEKGGFRIEDLAPGEYTLIALPDTDQFSTTFVRNLQNVQRYAALGTHVHIDAGQTTQIAITVIPDDDR